MEFTCYYDWVQLPKTADALFEQATQGGLFFSRVWLESVSSTLEADQTMVLACVVAENDVMAILPLVNSDGNHWQSLKHRYTTHYSLLVKDEASPALYDCLARGLDALGLHSILLEPVAEDDRRLVALQRAMEKLGYACEYYFRLYNWIYPVRGHSFADYMAARPARLRNTITRKQRKLQRDYGCDIQLFIGDAVPEAMTQYHAVYSASWKANEQYADFLCRVVAGFSRLGFARLAILSVRGQPVAAQLWFVVHDRANIFRLAYDEAWKPYSPGSILTRYLMEYVIDTDRVSEIDFLTGNDAYKQDWMSARRERFALSCVKRLKSSGRAGRLVDSLKRIVKG